MWSFLRSLFDVGPDPMRIIYYRTKNGRADYGFQMTPLADGNWRIYIVSQPPYGARASDAHSTHRLAQGGRQYICWTTPIRSEADAREIAALWADKTEDYILTGARF